MGYNIDAAAGHPGAPTALSLRRTAEARARRANLEAMYGTQKENARHAKHLKTLPRKSAAEFRQDIDRAFGTGR